MNDRVSVVIPYYNNEKYIDETLDSIFYQTMKPFEVIVVNDGSQPPSAEYAEGLKSTFPSLQVIHTANRGQSEARNEGARAATGKFLLFVDGDDRIGDSFIEKAVAKMNEDPELGLVYCKGEYFGARTGPWILPEYTLHRILFENMIPITALMYLEDFRRTGGFDKELQFFEDWDLWLGIIQQGRKVLQLDEVLFFYRTRDEGNSLSDNIREQKGPISDNYFRVFRNHYDFYKQNGIFFIDFFRIPADLFLRYQKKYYNQPHKKIYYGLLRLMGKKLKRDKRNMTGFEKIMRELKY